MTLSHSIGTAEVIKMRDSIAALHSDWSSEDIVRSTRTMIYAWLQAQCPMPCTSLTPDMQTARDRREYLTHSELQAQQDHQRAQVTSEQHDAYQRARASGDRNALNCKDAHHYVQMLHGTELWNETDRLCAEAGVK